MPGYSYKFLSSLRRKHICGLCHLPMKDAVVISTCRHRFCDNCLQDFLSDGVFKCPEDSQPLDYATIYPDTVIETEIMEMKVSCLHVASGCQWVDKMFNLKAHLESCGFGRIPCPNQCPAMLDSVAMAKHVKYMCPKRQVLCDHCKTEFTEEAMENHQGNCPYEMVWCENKCGARLQQRYLSNHMNNECHKRTQPCRHCGKQFVFETLQDHYHACPRFPVSCPNRCEPSKVAREELETHVRENCPSATVQCPFQYAGCKHLCPRYNLERHLEEQMKFHLQQMCLLSSAHERQITSLTNQISTLSGVMDGTLIWKIDLKGTFNSGVLQSLNSSMSSTSPPKIELCPLPLSSSNASTISSSATPPPLYPRLNKSRQLNINGNVNTAPPKPTSANKNCIQSPAFYTHRYGYKLVASVFPNGHGSGAGTHLSVYIGVASGEYDNLLEWPFRYPITFTLMDQCTDTEKRQHISESFLPNSSWKQFQKPSTRSNTDSLLISRGTNASELIMNMRNGENPPLPPQKPEQAMGFGYPKFVSHDSLKHGTFIKDDAIFLKISVDNSTFIAP